MFKSLTCSVLLLFSVCLRGVVVGSESTRSPSVLGGERSCFEVDLPLYPQKAERSALPTQRIARDSIPASESVSW